MSSADRAPVFELAKVSYRYADGTLGIRDVGLVIEAEERVALLGANGCGKSTLLQVLDGLLFPQEGTVRAFGEALREPRLREDGFRQAFRRRVGLVFQHADAQLFSSTVWEEIAFGPVHLGLTDAEVWERVADVLALFGLEGVQDRPPFRLSGGEKKKVALAAAVAMNPAVVLLDEPTSGLDPRTQRAVLDLLTQFGQAGKTLITATHDLDTVEELAERVLVFGEDHRVIADGAPAAILADKALLLRVNLIDPRFHTHGHDGTHRHYHIHN